MPASLFRTSALRATARPLASSSSQAASSSSRLYSISPRSIPNASSSSSSSRATRATALFALGASAVVLGLSTRPLHLDADPSGKPRRLRFHERIKAAPGGPRTFHQAAEDSEQEDSPTSGEGTDEADDAAADASAAATAAPLPDAAVDTAAQIAAEDAGAGAGAEPQEAAYDPSTGKINWDCPCLGGMAHGPCGNEFKDAFSCFVYSEEEPKGIECVGKFKAMQDCFRLHPEVYKEELELQDKVSGNSVQEWSTFPL